MARRISQGGDLGEDFLIYKRKERDDWTVRPGDLPAPAVMARIPHLAELEHNAVFRLLNRRRKRMRWFSTWQSKTVTLTIGLALAAVVAVMCFQSATVAFVYLGLVAILLFLTPGNPQPGKVKGRVVHNLTDADLKELINTEMSGIDYVIGLWGLELHPQVCKWKLRRLENIVLLMFITVVIPMQSDFVHFAIQFLALIFLGACVDSLHKTINPELSAFRSVSHSVYSGYNSVWEPPDEDIPFFDIGPHPLIRLPVDFVFQWILPYGCLIIGIAIVGFGFIGIGTFLDEHAGKYILPLLEDFGLFDKMPGNEPVLLVWLARLWPFVMPIFALCLLLHLRKKPEEIGDFPDFEPCFEDLGKTMDETLVLWRRTDPFEAEARD